MTFERLIRKLEVRLGQDLPAALAHEVMRAVDATGKPPQFPHTLPPKPGSVLILIYPGVDGAIHFPLVKRAEYPGDHSGQISFPGGKAEAGESTIQTALREAEEEVGVHPSEVTVLGVLSNFFVIPSNFMVTPVVGYATKRPQFVADKVEVVRVLEGDVRSLLPAEAIHVSEIVVAKTYKLQAPHFIVDNEMVWGATAMMLNEFRVIVNEVMEGED
jgi:8-oxo-dGTP pyrophosphatase MutT (NUDIX family)